MKLRDFSRNSQMNQVARLILNQKEIDKGYYANDADIKIIIGSRPETNINVRNASSEPPFAVVLYCMVLNYLTITGILEW